jgi:hypothetical protein
MSYIATNPASYAGQVVGGGQCVAFVKAAAGAPQTSLWQQGAAVSGSPIAAGTAIATFQAGQYTNTPGISHAAIYINQDANGLLVWDQWSGQPVHQRPIGFKGGVGAPVDDGNAYFIIE